MWNRKPNAAYYVIRAASAEFRVCAASESFADVYRTISRDPKIHGITREGAVLCRWLPLGVFLSAKM